MPIFYNKKNNANSTLAVSDIDNSQVTLEVTDATQFPDTPDFIITVWDNDTYPNPGDDSGMEVLKVTGISSNIFTVERGQENTTGVSHQLGDKVAQLFTVGQIEEIEEAFDNYLAKDNTGVYTPTLNYHPTTKLYVDSQIQGENHWDIESGNTLVPYVDNASVNIGTGNFTTSGTLGAGATTLSGNLAMSGNDITGVLNYTGTGSINSLDMIIGDIVSNPSSALQRGTSNVSGVHRPQLIGRARTGGGTDVYALVFPQDDLYITPKSLAGGGTTTNLHIGNSALSKRWTFGFNNATDTLILGNTGVTTPIFSLNADLDMNGKSIVDVLNITATGTGTFGQIIDNGLVATSGVYTDASKQLTDEVPSSGILGYWNRAGTTVRLATTNDILKLTSTTEPQFTIAYDASNDTEFSADSSGDLYIRPTGRAIRADLSLDLVINGDFDDGSTGWVETGAWTYGDDAGDFYVENGRIANGEELTQALGLSGLMEVTVDYLATNPIQGGAGIKIGSNSLALTRDGVRHQDTFLITASGSIVIGQFATNPGAIIKVWDIQVREAIDLTTGDMTALGTVKFKELVNVLAVGAGLEAIALSVDSEASGGGSWAIGRQSTVNVGDGGVLGYDSHVTGSQSFAFGRFCHADGNNGSMAMGRSCTASGAASMVYGNNCNTSAGDSFGFGRQITNSTTACIFMGINAINFRLTATGLVIGADSSAVGALDILSDSKIYIGAGRDTSISFLNGQDLSINSENVTANDEVHFTNFNLYSFDNDIVLPKTSGKGIKVDIITPTFGFADIIGDQFAKNTGATKPILTTYNGVINAWKFEVNDEAFITYHIPHDYVAGTPIFLHVHWSHIATTVTGGNVTFKLTSISAKAHNQEAFQSSPLVGTFIANASTIQYQQILSEIQYSDSSPTGLEINTATLEPDSVIELTFEVDANNITVSGGGVPDIFIHYVDIHYSTTGLIGTKQKAPDFYT